MNISRAIGRIPLWARIAGLVLAAVSTLAALVRPTVTWVEGGVDYIGWDEYRADQAEAESKATNRA